MSAIFAVGNHTMVRHIAALPIADMCRTYMFLFSPCHPAHSPLPPSLLPLPLRLPRLLLLSHPPPALLPATGAYVRCVCAMKPMRRAGGFQVSTLVRHKSILPPPPLPLPPPRRPSVVDRRETGYQEINRRFSFAFYVIRWSRAMRDVSGVFGALSATSAVLKVCVSNSTSGVSSTVSMGSPHHAIRSNVALKFSSYSPHIAKGTESYRI